MYVCVLCNHTVPDHNNFAQLKVIMSKMTGHGVDYDNEFVPVRETPPFLTGSKHLLPFSKDGQVICKGATTWAQFIEGQPRSTEMILTYNAEDERLVRAAHVRLLREHPVQA